MSLRGGNAAAGQEQAGARLKAEPAQPEALHTLGPVPAVVGAANVQGRAVEGKIPRCGGHFSSYWVDFKDWRASPRYTKYTKQALRSLLVWNLQEIEYSGQGMGRMWMDKVLSGEVHDLSTCAKGSCSESSLWPQTQIRSKPWAEGLWHVFAKWRLQRSRSTPVTHLGQFSCN